MIQSSLRFVTPALAVLMLQPSTASTQQKALPPASEVIARFVKAANLELLVTSHTSTRTKAKMEVPASGVSATAIEIRSKPNRVMQTGTSAGGGESKGGFDGEHAWSLDQTRGPRLIAGDELNDARLAANFTFPLRDTSLFKTRETLELAEYAGEKCYKLRMVTQAGRESFECFSVETGLLVAVQRKVTSPLGQVDNLSLYSDYKKFGGLVLASRIVSEVLGQRRIMTIESMSFDDVQPAEWVLPPPVKALIKP